ncbi:MAG TPA: 3-hydroxyacyl-CoA dehydrogenase NAD-binding domain-containing protein [Pirellulales bacterium]|jgi:3-hydroxyacyl-CoA dehydrogenase/enoyl-CoA hydratase/3-hydroxybutyryl-CoA epimerase/3-hydroxyacyl-CoA dehydrogenase/enoyl-CoA hydratase/3-hydroxybutyryl-CoA epimerase/enoyl-CoA isomerase|nr:3-hydroxyacyl-CoA dehydrogenase NAD-binding domain-containing protein [Pirellulales bacterium]
MPDATYLKLSFPEPDIAVLTFDDPAKSANVLSRAVLEEFEARFGELEKRPGLAGLVIASAKPGIFIAGADLREFAAAKNVTHADVVEIATRGRSLFERLSKVPFVTTAAIDGMCVGGGAELAMWCDRRLMTTNPKAQYGFPEVKLGMFPGWGGTARTPRMVGLPNAVELVTGGESIDGRAAALMGLATDVVAPERLEHAAIELIRAEQRSGGWQRDRERWSQPIAMNETELMFLGATAAAMIQQVTKGHYPAPMAALELMLGAASATLAEACKQEAEAFADIFGTPINRALINVFFLGDRNKKDRGIADERIEPREINAVGMFGAGIMGSGIAAACVKRDVPVTINDASPAALAGGVKKTLEEVSYNKAIKGSDPQKLLKYVPLVNATTVDSEFAACDLVIEAVVENPAIKKKLYARIEPQLRPEAILASNTSAISIGTLSQGLKYPERFVGLHFFNPVRQMPLVEVIRGPLTSDMTVATAVAFAKRLGKSPIVVNDGPGFLVNRLLLPYMNEALNLLAEGVPLKMIEAAAKEFGMPMGPMTLYDVVGLDTAYYAGQVMHAAFPGRIVESPILDTMVKTGRLGQKSGAGFFKYTDKKGRGEPDPTLNGLLAPLVKPVAAKLSQEQVTERLFLPMVLEATRILQDRLVRDARDVDLGLIYGIGFPPFKGGLLFWADTIGAAKIVERLKPYESLGERYRPTPMLLDLAKTGGTFYGRT